PRVRAGLRRLCPLADDRRRDRRPRGHPRPGRRARREAARRLRVRRRRRVSARPQRPFSRRHLILGHRARHRGQSGGLTALSHKSKPCTSGGLSGPFAAKIDAVVLRSVTLLLVLSAWFAIAPSASLAAAP